jgi:hypothetical protein
MTLDRASRVPVAGHLGFTSRVLRSATDVAG